MPERVLNFDELNIITREQIRDKVEAEIYSDLPDRKVDRKRCEDIIFDLLTMAYAYGIGKAGLELGIEAKPNDRMREDAIQAPTAGETVFDRMNTHINAAEDVGLTVDTATRLIEELATLIDTEAGRVANTAIFDTAEDFQRKNPDRIMMKRWSGILDDRIRDTHLYLDGTEVPLDAYFYSYSGDKALFPHGFQTAQENANCRCEIEVFTI